MILGIRLSSNELNVINFNVIHLFLRDATTVISKTMSRFTVVIFMLSSVFGFDAGMCAHT